jgi:bifunctional DNA-binding transcriptional regulator/antitoxin component of YhaV-PrlF toxin-antitoxin module
LCPASDTQIGGISPKTDERLNTRAGCPDDPAARSLVPHTAASSPAATAAAVISPVIPPRSRRSTAHGAHGRAHRPLPLPGSPPGVPLAPADAIYGMGRIDASGRVADRAVTCALGWTRGDRLVLTADAGVVLARRDPSGPVIVPPRPYVTIPIPPALRRRCGLRAGDQVLLAAIPGRDTLAAYSFAVLHQAIRAHGAFPCRKEKQP